jgi:hypothetical protein
MPATYAAQHFFSRLAWKTVEFDVTTTDATVADLGTPQAGTDKLLSLTANGGLLRLAVKLLKTVGTGNTDGFEIIAATNAAGTGSPTVVVAHAAPTGQNAVGDYMVLEVDINQIREVLATATHVGVRLEPATNTDEFVISAIAEYAHKFPGLTADFIS